MELQQRWSRGNSLESRDPVRPKCCRPRGNPDESLSPSTPELSLLSLHSISKVVLSLWPNVEGLEGENSRGAAVKF